MTVSSHRDHTAGTATSGPADITAVQRDEEEFERRARSQRTGLDRPSPLLQIGGAA